MKKLNIIKDYSYKITNLIQILTILNFNVEIDPSLTSAGRIYYSTKTIKINESDPKYALMTIIHELGHYIGLRLLGIVYYLFFSKKLREKTAEIIGGIILIPFQIDLNVPKISIKEWVKFHKWRWTKKNRKNGSITYQVISLKLYS